MVSIMQKTFFKISKESDISIEVIILMVFGEFMLLFGVLLFGINTGALPYAPDSTYGLFLVIVSFQIITMGKTPFGDLRRSWLLVIIGICTAIIGMVASFIPGYISVFVRILVGALLFAGGITLLLQLFFSKEKAKIWIRVPGVLQHLTIACIIVYTLTIIVGLITLFPGITSTLQTAVITIIYGISFFYLSGSIYKVKCLYPTEKAKNSKTYVSNTDDTNSKGIFILFKDASLSLTFAILIMLGTLLTLLGIFLFPVNFGLIPFSPDGQLGLLLFIFSIQMMALGETLLGPFKRSWLIVILGLVFAALGIFSCVVPGILTDVIQKLIGSLSIIGGGLLLIQRFVPLIRKKIKSDERVETPIKNLMIIQTLINIAAIVFGLSTLAVGLLAGMVVAGMLVIYGLLLFILVFILNKMNKIVMNEENQKNSI